METEKEAGIERIGIWKLELEGLDLETQGSGGESRKSNDGGTTGGKKKRQRLPTVDK